MKKIVFRVNYHTVTGQSLWVKISVKMGDATFEHLLPMRWISRTQWQTEWETGWSTSAGFLLFTYRYVFRQDGNGVELEEWGGPRMIGAFEDAVVALDTWCSAGTVDHAYATKAFGAVTKRRVAGAVESRGNHDFQLRMAAVPEGMAVCLTGNAEELGCWDPARALVMAESAPDVWKVRVGMAAGRDVDYKYGLYDVAEGRLVHLEKGENRRIHSPVVAENQSTRISDEAYRRDDNQLFRGAGVAVPVFSLRSRDGLGVGEFPDLRPLADWAASTGLKMIQILPVNDTTSSHTWTDSYPYSAISAFALHPIYLRVDGMGFTMPEDFHRRLGEVREKLNSLPGVNHEGVMAAKTALLREIYDAHRSAIHGDAGFRAFVEGNRGWVVPYAAFCLLRDRKGTADFSKWGEWAAYDAARVAELAREGGPDWDAVAWHLWLQYELDRQLMDAVGHLHGRGVVLKGDLPIGIDRESVDAWSAPELYHMDAQTGAPPDAFAVKGQNWGFPTYNWGLMKQDGYAWWRERFARLSRYFDAYRIDHILGFFRIWQVPYEQVDGIMGWFDPALAIHLDEIWERGIPFDRERFCVPYLREESLEERFGADVAEVKARFLDDRGKGAWRLKPEVDTQRKIICLPDDALTGRVREALLDCVSDVLLFEVPGAGGEEYHPRCGMQLTRSYAALDADTKARVEDLYNDYFYRRQEDHWQAQGYEKLPAMRRASNMLLCGEDLGMVPACVPGVLKETGILSLEIQRMPKVPGSLFFNPADAPYMSVVSPSTHDMPTLREWWTEDREATKDFAWEMFGIATPPEELDGALAERIIAQHLHSPAMWAVFPLQDLLAMDETLRHPDAAAERINVPAIMPYYWRYRMHLEVDVLAAAENFNARLGTLVRESGR
jgi:4-alpha-glucanotransferase